MKLRGKTGANTERVSSLDVLQWAKACWPRKLVPTRSQDLDRDLLRELRPRNSTHSWNWMLEIKSETSRNCGQEWETILFSIKCLRFILKKLDRYQKWQLTIGKSFPSSLSCYFTKSIIFEYVSIANPTILFIWINNNILWIFIIECRSDNSKLNNVN